MLNDSFNALAERPRINLRPAALCSKIEEMSERMYNSINNGVYRCGFAQSQAAYDRAFSELFASLDYFEAHLGKNRFICGTRFTEADIRLFVTLVRFDPVYATHFKTNRNLIRDMPNLSSFLRDVYQMPHIASTVRFDHFVNHYYKSHPQINPFRIVPGGPTPVDHSAPHNRTRLSSADPLADE